MTDLWKPKISKETASKLLQTHIGGISHRGRRRQMYSPYLTAFWVVAVLALVAMTLLYLRS